MRVCVCLCVLVIYDYEVMFKFYLRPRYFFYLEHLFVFVRTQSLTSSDSHRGII